MTTFTAATVPTRSVAANGIRLAKEREVIIFNNAGLASSIDEVRTTMEGGIIRIA